MKTSAGILLYRYINKMPEVFLVHPGGPFWKNKDDGAWSIPKGEYDTGEDPLLSAKREFHEETGTAITGTFIPLNPIKQKGGKIVIAWAVRGDIDANTIVSNTFSIEWPPRSGKTIVVPEIDRAGWFTPDIVRQKLNPAQIPLVDELLSFLGS